MKCPRCVEGWMLAAFRKIQIKCPICNGTGQISEKQLEWIKQGEQMRQYRLKELKISLRQAWKRFNVDPAILSKMERGAIKPDITIYQKYEK